MPFVLQSRTDHTDAELAKEGKNFPASRLHLGGNDRLALWKDDKAKLAPFGFTDDWVGAMVLALADLEAKKGIRGAADADHSASDAAGKAFHEVAAWVGLYNTAILLAPRAVATKAAHPAHGWESSAHLSGEVSKLIEFCKTRDFPVGESRSAAFAADGQAKLDAYVAAHGAQSADNVTPEVTAMRIADGLVAFELKRLAAAAKQVLPHERAAKYAIGHLRGGSHHPKEKV